MVFFARIGVCVTWSTERVIHWVFFYCVLWTSTVIFNFSGAQSGLVMQCIKLSFFFLLYSFPFNFFSLSFSQLFFYLSRVLFRQNELQTFNILGSKRTILPISGLLWAVSHDCVIVVISRKFILHLSKVQFTVAIQSISYLQFSLGYGSVSCSALIMETYFQTYWKSGRLSSLQEIKNCKEMMFDSRNLLPNRIALL